MAAEVVSKSAPAKFEFTFRSILGQDERLMADINIPFTDDVTELAQHIIARHPSDPVVKCMDILSGMI